MTAPIIPLITDPDPLIASAKRSLVTHPNIALMRGRLMEVYEEERPPRLVPVDRARIRGLLDCDAEVRALTSGRQVPSWLVSHLAKATTWPEMVELAGVTDVPLLRQDGTLIDEHGYDPPTGLWREPQLEIEVPEAPTRADAQAALAELERLAAHFPLLSETQRSAFLAALLTPFVVLDAPTPLFLFDSPSRGPGATEAADAISRLVRGSAMTRLEPPASGRVFRRQLARLCRPEESLLLLDGGNELTCRAALETAVQDVHWLDGVTPGPLRRRIGWYARTVNSQLTRESASFVLPIRFLDTIDQRLGPVFTLPADLDAHLKAERARYVRAALTLLRAYVVAGRPAVEVARWSGFDAWRALVPAALVWAGRVDPLLARRANEAALIDDETELRDAILTLALVLTRRVGLTTPELLAALDSEDRDALACRRALEAALGTDQLTSRLVGRFLSQHRGRCVEGWFIQRVGSAMGGYARWTAVQNPLTEDLAARIQRSPKPWDPKEENVRFAEDDWQASFTDPKAPIERVGEAPLTSPLPRSESSESAPVVPLRTRPRDNPEVAHAEAG
jgi:hypothetical protein